MRQGFALFAGISTDVIKAAAREAEARGYASFWVNHPGPIDGLAALGAAAGETRRVALGIGVIPLNTRGPASIVEGVRVNALPLERLLLGVGSPNPGALGRVRAGVRELRGGLSTRIVVAALGPKMCELAGEVADGVLLNYLPASHVPWSVEQVRKGGDATIYAYVHAGVCEREDGIALARRDLFSYAVVDSYARNFERAGFADEVAEIRARHAERDREGALAAVSDRMVDAIDIMGDAPRVRAAVEEYVEAGVQVPVLMPLPWGPDRNLVIERTLTAAATGE